MDEFKPYRGCQDIIHRYKGAVIIEPFRASGPWYIFLDYKDRIVSASWWESPYYAFSSLEQAKAYIDKGFSIVVRGKKVMAHLHPKGIFEVDIEDDRELCETYREETAETVYAPDELINEMLHYVVAPENLKKYEYHVMPSDEAVKELARFPLPRKSIGKSIRNAVYEKCHGHCAYCGKEISLAEMQIDHIKAHMYENGEDSIDNYHPSCDICNRVKGCSTLEQFRNEIIPNCTRIHKNRKKPVNYDSDKIAERYHEDPVVFYFEKEEAK